MIGVGRMPGLLTVLALCTIIARVGAFQGPSFIPQSRFVFASKASSFSVPPRSMMSSRQGELRMTATAEPQAKVEQPSMTEMESLPMGYKAMLEDMHRMRTGEIVSAWKKGDIGKREASTLTLKRLSYKLGVAGKKPVAPGLVEDDRTNSKKATFMEGGWEKRGKGSSVLRTVEIYSFCIKIILREVKLRKVEDKAAKSAARTEIARDLKEVTFSPQSCQTIL